MKRILLSLLVFSAISLTSVDSFAQSNCGYGGTWKTVWDGVECEVIMSMSGDHMSGSYSYHLGGKYITGKLSGRITDRDGIVRMKGTWSENSGIAGTFEFARVCNKEAFSGSWSNNNGRESGSWVGAKK